MEHPMGWFRANNCRIAWLAFFALASQFALTFGHVHPSTASAILAVPPDSANGRSGTQSFPPQKTPAGLAQDFCAVCNNITLANTLVLPVSPAAATPRSVIQRSRRPATAVGFASPKLFHFNARG